MAPKYVMLFGLFLLLVLQLFGNSGASPAFGNPRETAAEPMLPAALFPDAVAQHPGWRTLAAENAGEAERSLFEITPLGWDMDTIGLLYRWTAALPQKLPGYVRYVMEQSRLFGAVGSILLALFIIAALYSVIGRKRVSRRIEEELQPLWARVPAQTHPHLASLIRIAVSPLAPLLFLGVFLLTQSFIHYEGPWFLPIKKLLGLWAAGVLLMNLFREILTNGLLPFCPRYGNTLFRMLRLVPICVVVGMAIVWGAEAIGLPDDVKAFLRFAVSLVIASVLSSLFLNKEALLSLLPPLPYRSYTAFATFLHRAYFPLALLTFLMGILWCLGYRRSSEVVWIKTWGVAGAYVAIMLSYHLLSKYLLHWSQRKENIDDEARQFFFGSARAFLNYGTVTIAALIMLHLLGLLAPLRDVMSHQVFTIGGAPLSLLVLIEAGLILFAFAYASHLLQAYLNYEIYPSVGIDAGLGYALDTFLRYFLYGVGCFAALRVIGLDLRVLLVFAGGAGIGAGIGLQHVAANIVSGFIIIFGRKLRKGDWIKVGNNLGKVTHIYLRATKIWTRDNIEYIVPNTDFIVKPLVNYTLSSPIVRVYVPVGVSYDADPDEVRKILLECAEKHRVVTQFRKPDVRIAEFGENSLNFELLVWIDIGKTAEKDIRSRLYFTIIEALKAANIEIPNPQRDVRIRSASFSQTDLRPGNWNQKDSDLCITGS